jgi:hypothetical protein
MVVLYSDFRKGKGMNYLPIPDAECGLRLFSRLVPYQSEVIANLVLHVFAFHNEVQKTVLQNKL